MTSSRLSPAPLLILFVLLALAIPLRASAWTPLRPLCVPTFGFTKQCTDEDIYLYEYEKKEQAGLLTSKLAPKPVVRPVTPTPEPAPVATPAGRPSILEGAWPCGDPPYLYDLSACYKHNTDLGYGIYGNYRLSSDAPAPAPTPPVAPATAARPTKTAADKALENTQDQEMGKCYGSNCPQSRATSPDTKYSYNQSTGQIWRDNELIGISTNRDKAQAIVNEDSKDIAPNSIYRLPPATLKPTVPVQAGPERVVPNTTRADRTIEQMGDSCGADYSLESQDFKFCMIRSIQAYNNDTVSMEQYNKIDKYISDQANAKPATYYGTPNDNANYRTAVEYCGKLGYSTQEGITQCEIDTVNRLNDPRDPLKITNIVVPTTKVRPCGSPEGDGCAQEENELRQSYRATCDASNLDSGFLGLGIFRSTDTAKSAACAAQLEADAGLEPTMFQKKSSGTDTDSQNSSQGFATDSSGNPISGLRTTDRYAEFDAQRPKPATCDAVLSFIDNFISLDACNKESGQARASIVDEPDERYGIYDDVYLYNNPPEQAGTPAEPAPVGYKMTPTDYEDWYNSSRNLDSYNLYIVDQTDAGQDLGDSNTDFGALLQDANLEILGTGGTINWDTFVPEPGESSNKPTREFSGAVPASDELAGQSLVASAFGAFLAPKKR